MARLNVLNRTGIPFLKRTIARTHEGAPARNISAETEQVQIVNGGLLGVDCRGFYEQLQRYQT
jgi:hypothetical protein